MGLAKRRATVGSPSADTGQFERELRVLQAAEQDVRRLLEARQASVDDISVPDMRDHPASVAAYVLEAIGCDVKVVDSTTQSRLVMNKSNWQVVRQASSASAARGIVLYVRKFSE